MTAKIESAKPIESAEEFAKEVMVNLFSRHLPWSDTYKVSDVWQLSKLIEARDEQIREAGKCDERDVAGVGGWESRVERAFEAGKVEGLREVLKIISDDDLGDQNKFGVTPRRVVRLIRAEIERRGGKPDG